MAAAAIPASKAAGVLSASDILAKASSSAATITYKTDDLSYDLGILTATDTHPLEPAASAEDWERVLLTTATQDAQLLIRRMWDLPTTMTETGPVALLPERVTKLPRTKPAPKPKQMTRWEKFALEKGIQKRKKGRMVWDEETQDWLPRHGYGRSGDLDKDWVIPVKPGDDPMADPFEARELAKKQRVVKNQLNRVKNMERASGGADSKVGAVPATTMLVEGNRAAGVSGSALVAPRVKEGVPKAPKSAKAVARAEKILSGRKAGAAATAVETDAHGRPLLVPAGVARLPADGPAAEPGTKRVREPKAVKTERLRIAQGATASLGKFDKMIAGEPARPKDPKKQKRLPVETAASSERALQESVLKRIMGGSGEGEAASAGGMRAPKSKSKSGSASAAAGVAAGKKRRR